MMQVVGVLKEGRKFILVVEANPILRNMLALFIAAEGHPVLTCADEKEAVTIVSAYFGQVRAAIFCGSPDETASVEGIRTFGPGIPAIVLASPCADPQGSSGTLILPDRMAEEVRLVLKRLDEAP